MYKDCHLFDTSDYDKDHFLYNKFNKKITGEMKDECSGKVIQKFVRLKSKMYSLLYDGIEKKKAKGIKKCQVKKL